MNGNATLPSCTVHCGNCLDILPTLEAESVQTCITSPPYWGLRDFGVNGALGLEATPQEYIANMVAVFREVWRVLRWDGTLWVNMGDCYASNGACGGGSVFDKPIDGRPEYGGKNNGRPVGREADKSGKIKIGGTAKNGLKPKDLCMMPARLAMALQADGWYLRSDIIWHKPNPMPESVTDRPTKAHEYIFLLTKRERYYYDSDAIREKSSEDTKPQNRSMDSKMAEYGNGVKNNNDFMRSEWYKPEFRNKRSVWTITTQPYAEAHFATFPEEIPKLCILAGSKPGDVILDPFAGSGTTGQVALELGRKAILIELNPDYIELAEERTFVTPAFF